MEAICEERQSDPLKSSRMRNIRQNLFFAFIYNVLGVPVLPGSLSIHRHPLNPMVVVPHEPQLSLRYSQRPAVSRRRNIPFPGGAATDRAREALCTFPNELLRHNYVKMHLIYIKKRSRAGLGFRLRADRRFAGFVTNHYSLKESADHRNRIGLKPSSANPFCKSDGAFKLR